MDNDSISNSPLIVLARLSYSLDVNKYIEILESNDIVYQLTGLGIDDTSMEHLTIWVPEIDYDKATRLMKSGNDYFMKCPNCGSVDISLHHVENIKNTFLGLLKTMITGRAKHSYNQNVCDKCNQVF